MCTRRLGDLYCDYAERYRGYQMEPPELRYTGPDHERQQLTRIRFPVSKLSAVELKVSRERRVLQQDRQVPPRRRLVLLAAARPGTYTVASAPRSCAPGRARRTGPLPRSRSGPAPYAPWAAWRPGRSSTRARAASARRASRPPPPGAARRRGAHGRAVHRPGAQPVRLARGRAGRRAGEVGPNLFAQEVQAQEEMERNWDRSRTGSASCSTSAAWTGSPPRS